MFNVVLLVVIVCLGFVSNVSAISSTHFEDCGSCIIADIVRAPNNVVLLLMTDYKLFRSADEGIEWELLEFGRVTEIIQEPRNPSWIIARNESNFVFISKDGLATYTIKQLPKPDDSGYNSGILQMHPNKFGRLLYLPCKGVFPIVCVLFWSFDDGDSWNNRTTSTRSLTWSFYTETPDTIFEYQGNTFGYTTDYEQTFVPLFEYTVGFVYTRNFMWVGVVKPGDEGMTLYASSSKVDITHMNKTSYVESIFPFGDEVPQYVYNFLDDSPGAGFVGLVSANNWGGIYTSEYEGASFVLSLDHASVQNAVFDFNRIGGIAGLYIANTVTNWESTGSVQILRSQITFDSGGEWRYITPPLVDANGDRYPCFNSSDHCKLNLYGHTSWMLGGPPPFYSTSNAIGLMIAVGNVGVDLENTMEDLGTFLSRDGGLYWFELDDRETIYEFGDHGGILLWAPTSTPTTTLWYSLDEGFTKSPFEFSKHEPVIVENIITEPGGASQKFILYGSFAQPTNRSNVHAIFGLNFNDSQPRICTDEDFETFVPNDGRHGEAHCVLGRTITYQRRLRAAKCYNNRTTEHIVSVTSCPCSFEDYECEFGYIPSRRNETAGFNCTLATGQPPPDPPAVCPPGTNYTVPTGYHLIADDVCVGGLDLNAKIKPCPPAPPTATTTTEATTSATTSETTATASTTTSEATSTTSEATSSTTTSETTSTTTTSHATTTTSTAASATTTTSGKITSTTTTSHSGATATSSTTSSPVPKEGGGAEGAIIAVSVITFVALAVVGIVIWRNPSILQRFTGFWKRKFAKDGEYEPIRNEHL